MNHELSTKYSQGRDDVEALTKMFSFKKTSLLVVYWVFKSDITKEESVYKVDWDKRDIIMSDDIIFIFKL